MALMRDRDGALAVASTQAAISLVLAATDARMAMRAGCARSLLALYAHIGLVACATLAWTLNAASAAYAPYAVCALCALVAHTYALLPALRRTHGRAPADRAAAREFFALLAVLNTVIPAMYALMIALNACGALHSAILCAATVLCTSAIFVFHLSILASQLQPAPRVAKKTN